MDDICYVFKPYYPLFVDLQGKKAVVVGGGKVAERKVISLFESGAKVTVISPDITRELFKLKGKKVFTHIEREYQKGDLKDAFVVIAATSSKTVNQKISQEAPFLVNIVDDPESCNFIVPSVIRRSPLILAISTQGSSPAFSKTIRKELDQLLPTDISTYLQWLNKTRKLVKTKIQTQNKRQELLNKLASSEILKLLRANGLARALEKAEQICQEYF